MALLTEGFELSDGTVLTYSNTWWAGGINGSWEADTSRAMHGSASALCNRVASTSSTCIKNGLTSSAMAYRGYYYFTVASTQDNGLVSFYDGINKVIDLYWISNSNLRLADDSGTQWTSPSTMPLNQWVRLEIFATAATSNATLNASVFIGDSDTATYSYTSSTANTGTGFTQLYAGISTSAYASNYWLDSLALETAATGFVGPPSVPTEEAWPVQRLVTIG